ncbi:bifunctional demethylmenaquinone methyltransferase/2-methoxy-6-polyprenyl-1,4-benzoquinol methylase UbiE [soil metagenome]
MTGRAALPTGAAKVAAVRAMFDRIAPRYDLLNRLMTFGMDVRWRRRAVAALDLPAQSLVLDVACGTGDLCRDLAGAGHLPIGLDFSAGMLAAARTGAPLVQADALALPVAGQAADGITCGFALRNVESLPRLFTELARVLRPGGRLSILEVAEPDARLLRAGHHLYFRRLVPLIGGLLSDRDAYGYLPRSTAYLPRRESLVAMVMAAGFDAVRVHPLALGAAQLITATRAGAR